MLGWRWLQPLAVSTILVQSKQDWNSLAVVVLQHCIKEAG